MTNQQRSGQRLLMRQRDHPSRPTESEHYAGRTARPESDSQGKLAEDTADVGLNRVLGDRQVVRDAFIGAAAGSGENCSSPAKAAACRSCLGEVRRAVG